MIILSKRLKRILVAILILLMSNCGMFGAEYKPGNWHRIESSEFLEGTELLDWKGDFGQRLMKEASDFMDKIIAESAGVRDARWKHKAKSISGYLSFLEAKREKLARLLGIRELRKSFDAPQILGTLNAGCVIQETTAWKMFQIKWDVFDDYAAQGFLVEPNAEQNGNKIDKVIIALAHDGMCPKAYFQSLPELQKEAQSGHVRIVLPASLNRETVSFKNARLPRRELIWRESYVLGRHLIGYEIEAVRAIIDWIKKDPRTSQAKIEIGGYGDGGMIALYAGALDRRIDQVRCAGYFGDRSGIWEEPIDRGIHGILNEFGNAELGAMIFPRALLIEKGQCPEMMIVPETFRQSRFLALGTELKNDVFPARCWAPGILRAAKLVDQELARTNRIIADLPGTKPKIIAASVMTPIKNSETEKYHENPEYQKIQTDLLQELDVHTQTLMRSSSVRRAAFMKKLAVSSVAELEESSKWYRNYFLENIAGRFDKKFVPIRPRSRKVYEEARWQAYDVVLDVFDGFSAYGLLVLPRDLKRGEKRPVVVFQHGREGCPDSGINGSRAYNAVVPRLIDRGFIVFCPQNLYIRGDEYRVLHQKCDAVGKGFFGLMIAQHEQILSWLTSLPWVQADRIGFYGISYGGKSAMFIPAVETRYALSVCCADFNERIVKCASTEEKFSFMGTPEYEMYDFDAGDTFNYAELAMLIAPRPFMVERGRRDGVGIDEYVAYEFARVARFYEHFPELRGRAKIEYFDGVHEIRFDGVAKFLDQFLK